MAEYRFETTKLSEMGQRRRARRLATLLIATAIATLPLGPIGAGGSLTPFAAAQAAAVEQPRYRISAGDTLELVVVRLPQLSTLAQVTSSGEVSFPLVGVIDAAGLEIDEVRDTVRGILANKVLDGFDPAQPNSMVLLDPEEVDVRIAVYRPVYVDGDVENRGAIVYRPGLTVRQAIVEAGGYAFDRYLLEDNGMSEAAMRAAYQALWIDYATYSWRTWTLRSELGEEPGPRPDTSKFPVAREAVEIIGQVEQTRLFERNNAFNALMESLEVRKNTAAERLVLLEQQLDEEQKAVAFDRDELVRAEGLLERGTGTRTRVADIRRTLLLSSSRFLQVQSQLAEFEREAQMAAQDVSTARADRRVNLLDELTEAQSKLAKTREEIEATAERLSQKTRVRQVRPLGSTSSSAAGDVSVSIFRAATGETIDNAGANEIIAPGDVVEVRLAPLDL